MSCHCHGYLIQNNSLAKEWEEFMHSIPLSHIYNIPYHIYFSTFSWNNSHNNLFRHFWYVLDSICFQRWVSWMTCPFSTAWSSTSSSAISFGWLFRHRQLVTVEFTGVKKTGKIPQAFWYHWNVSLTLGNDLVASLKINLYIQKRYGHPDMQNLATLKQKIWIVRF